MAKSSVTKSKCDLSRSINRANTFFIFAGYSMRTCRCYSNLTLRISNVDSKMPKSNYSQCLKATGRT